MENNDLQLSYGVKFDVKQGGEDATAEIQRLSDKWQDLLDSKELVIRFSTDGEMVDFGINEIKSATEALDTLEVSYSKLEKSAKKLYNENSGNTIVSENSLNGIKELSKYYAELEQRSRDFYDANKSDKSAALDGMKKRLEQIKKEMADIEYGLIGITEKKKPRAETTIQLEWIEDLKKEAAGIQTAMASLSDLNMGGAPADVQRLNTELTTTNFTLLQMKEHYKQVAIENAKLVKDATSNPNTKDVYSMKESDISQIEAKIAKLRESARLFGETASKVGFDDEKLNGATRKANDELIRLQQKLVTIQSSFGNRSLNSLLQINPKSIQETNALMAELSRRRDSLNKTDPGYANSLSDINRRQAQLTAENTRALEVSRQKEVAINAETAAFGKQSNMISSLKRMAVTYLSIYQGVRLVQNIAKITGEFELQEKSLAAIIQSAEKASEIFGQIKGLAVISPFTFKELVSYTKQLAAYRVETDQLYDTTKKLADVSAGLGVDMNRIILAYGQVQAASVLRGQELRQFTEAGIPLVALLADKFTELEGRVVSTGEVFGKISERMVSFEMVKDIFADMTNEGGMFFNMQEIQAETLAGKISNLTDSYQIMFASIGEKGVVNDTLKGAVELATSLARNWESVAAVFVPLLAGLSAYKLGLLSLSAVEAINTAIYNKKIASQTTMIGLNEKESLSLTRKAAIQSASLIANKAQIASNEVLSLISTKNIALDNKEIASKSIKTAVVKAGTNATKLANLQAEITNILVLQGVSADKAGALARLSLARATRTATASTITFGATVKSVFASIPGWGLILLAISALTSLVAFIIQSNMEANKLKNELSDIGNAGIGETDKLKGKFKQLSKTVLDSSKSLKEQNDALNTLKQMYGDILPDYMLTIDGLQELRGEYEDINAAIESHIDVKTREKKINAVADNYQEKTNPVISKLKKDLGDLGVDSILAGNAIDELLKRINKGGVSDPYKELLKILKQINGTTTKLSSESIFENWDISQVVSGAGKLNKILLEQKKIIAGLNDDTTFFGVFDKQAKALDEEIKKAVEQVIQGRKTIDDKITYFDESLYQYNDRKATVQKDKLIEFITKTKAEAAKAISVNDNDLAFGMTNWVEMTQKRLANLRISPLAENINKIIERVSGEQGVSSSQYNSLQFKGDNNEDFLKDVASQYSLIKEQIDRATKANEDFVSGVMGNVNSKGLVQLTKEEYLNGYIDTNGKVQKGLYQELEMINAIRAANGLRDKELKEAVKTNPRIAAIESEIALVEQAKKKYEELVKVNKSPEQSKTIVDDLYKDQFKLKNSKGELLFKPVITEQDLIAALNKGKDELKKIPKTEQPVFKVNLKINDSEIKIFTDEMKSKLSEIEKEFNTNKKRIDIFSNIFDITGDYSIATKIAESIEGEGTTDIETALNASFKKSFESINMQPMFDKLGNVDISASQAEIDKLDKTNEFKAQAQKQLDIVKEFRAKEISELIKGLSDFGTYQERRTKIVRDAEVERLKIASSSLPKEAIDSLLVSNKNKETKDLSKLAIENFKDSDMWQVVFSDLDKVSNESIALLKDRVEDFIKEAGKGFDPTEMREMVKSLETLEDRLKGVKTKDLLKDIFSKPDLAPLKAAVDEAKKEYDKLLAAKDAATIKNTNAADSVIAAKRTQDPTKIKDAEDAQIAANSELIESDKKLTSATKILTDAEKKYQEIADKRKKATHAAIKQNNEYVDAVKAVKDVVDATSDAFYQMADVMGLTVSDETRAIIDGISKGLGALIAILGAVSAMLIIIDLALAPIIAVIWPLIAAFAALGLAFAIFKEIKLGGINRELKEQAKIVEDLEKRYSELEKSMEKALGVDWIKDYNEQMKNLSDQAKSLQVQIDLSRKKGKDENKDDTKDLVDKLEDVNSLIADASSKLQNYLVGTDLTSAAKDFASAWLDAYKSFGSTTDAMKVKFKDMMNNLAVNMLLSKGFERLLSPVFDMLELEAKKGELTSEGWNNILQLMDKTIPNLDAWGRAITQKFDFKSLQDSTENLNGLSKGISSITEDTGLLLGGYLDSIRFRLFAYFDFMESVDQFDLNSSMAMLMIAQNKQIDHLEGIKSNTLRSAIASENLSSKIDSVIAISTVGGGYAIKVNA